MAGQEGTMSCKHCWHRHNGPILLVVHDGEIVQTCCRCHRIRTIHRDHEHEEA